jgi:hypothetical protein
MRRHQRGMTMIGWLCLLVPVAIVFYAGIRLTPIYLNYMKVTKCLKQVSTEVEGSTATADGLRNVLSKHFDIDGVDFPDIKDIKIARVDGIWTLEASYDDQAPLFANIAILVTFDKVVSLKSGLQ